MEANVEDKRPYKIYTLEFMKQVFYVGVTQMWLAQRLKSHKNEDHITAKHRLFKEFPDSIKINEIDRAETKEEALRLEKYWIDQLTSWGFTLYNIHRDKPRLKRYTRSLIKIELDESELQHISINLRHGDATRISELANVGPEMIRLHLVGKKPKIKYETYRVICDYYKLPDRFPFLKNSTLIGSGE